MADRPRSTDPDPETVSFGYKTVPAEERQGLVNDVFTKVASRYDLMNDLMSGGLHRLWKDDLIGWLAPPRSDRAFRLLDVAGGTGDVTVRFLRAGGRGCTATLFDISPEMIAVARKRLADAGLEERATLVVGNAEALPFADKSFDAYTVAFGIRNVTHIDKALAEAYRVLKTGGRFLCLEFSDVEMPVLDRVYEEWSFRAIPQIGRLVTGDGEPYAYLVESIRKFPRKPDFAAMIGAAGFDRVTWRSLSGGIAALHSAWKL
jgi:demethylmenaquinone methyltransferase/2-methoxy-6-polyprenyl-1,4-benzoquinol methylase